MNKRKNEINLDPHITSGMGKIRKIVPFKFAIPKHTLLKEKLEILTTLRNDYEANLNHLLNQEKMNSNNQYYQKLSKRNSTTLKMLKTNVLLLTEKINKVRRMIANNKKI